MKNLGQTTKYVQDFFFSFRITEPSSRSWHLLGSSICSVSTEPMPLVALLPPCLFCLFFHLCLFSHLCPTEFLKGLSLNNLPALPLLTEHSSSCDLISHQICNTCVRFGTVSLLTECRVQTPDVGLEVLDTVFHPSN